MSRTLGALLILALAACTSPVGLDETSLAAPHTSSSGNHTSSSGNLDGSVR